MKTNFLICALLFSVLLTPTAFGGKIPKSSKGAEEEKVDKVEKQAFEKSVPPTTTPPQTKPQGDGAQAPQTPAEEEALVIQQPTIKWTKQDDEAADRKNFEISAESGAGHRKPGEEVRLQVGNFEEATGRALGVSENEQSLLNRVDGLIARINDPSTPSDVKRELAAALQTIDTGVNPDVAVQAAERSLGASSPVQDLITDRRDVLAAVGERDTNSLVIKGSAPANGLANAPLDVKFAAKKEDEARAAGVKGGVSKSSGSLVGLQNAGKPNGTGAYGWSPQEQMVLMKKSEALMGLLRDRLKQIPSMKDLNDAETPVISAMPGRLGMGAERGVASVKAASVESEDSTFPTKSLIVTLMGLFSTAALYEWWAASRKEGLSLLALLGFAPRKKK